MAVVTILTNALRDSLTSPVFAVPGGGPRHIQLRMTSPTYGADPALSFALQVDQSLDGGAHWEHWFGVTSQGGSAGQVFRGVVSDGLADVTASFDGAARQIRAVITVNTPFVWGLTGEVLAT